MNHYGTFSEKSEAQKRRLGYNNVRGYSPYKSRQSNDLEHKTEPIRRSSEVSGNDNKQTFGAQRYEKQYAEPAPYRYDNIYQPSSFQRDYLKKSDDYIALKRRTQHYNQNQPN